MTVAVDTVAGTERDQFAACDGGCNSVEANRIHHPAQTSTQEQHVSLDERQPIPPLRIRSAELLERGPRHRAIERQRGSRMPHQTCCGVPQFWDTRQFPREHLFRVTRT